MAVRCSIRLEVPIARAGKLLVSEEYLGVLTDMANAKMDVNRDRTDKFMDMFVAQVSTVSALSAILSAIESCTRPEIVAAFCFRWKLA